MKTVHDLTPEELEELREAYFHQLEETEPEVLGDITEPEGIPIDNIIVHYEGVMFVDDDFFCNQ